MKSLIFLDSSCCDLFTPIFNHDHDSIIVDFSKPPFYDDLSYDEVETPHIVESLQPTLMVMSSPHCPEVGFTSDHEIMQSPKAPHPSSIYIEDKSHT